MKVVVDFDICQSNAVCMEVAPKVFEVRDDGYLYVLAGEAARVAAGRSRRGSRTLPHRRHHLSKADTRLTVTRDGLWVPARRGMTVGLILLVTLIAFEALAVNTALPAASEELGGVGLYGWVFAAFMLSTVAQIAVSGRLIDERGLYPVLVGGAPLFCLGLAIWGRRAVDARAGRRPRSCRAWVPARSRRSRTSRSGGPTRRSCAPRCSR